MQLEMHGRPVMKWMGLLVGMLGALFFFFAALMFIDEGNHAGALLASSTAGFLAVHIN